MIIYPSIDKLLEKVPSRYSLAVLAAKRAHELELPCLSLAGLPLIKCHYWSEP